MKASKLHFRIGSLILAIIMFFSILSQSVFASDNLNSDENDVIEGTYELEGNRETSLVNNNNEDGSLINNDTIPISTVNEIGRAHV